MANTWLTKHMRSTPCATSARCIKRRDALLASISFQLVCLDARSEQSRPQSLQARLDQSPAGAVIKISGALEERIMVSKKVTIASSSSLPAQLQWQTTKPYESTIQILPGGDLQLINVTVGHRSPSVANNYAVFVQGGRLEAVSCDISSSTGSGIGVEGGQVICTDSVIHDCQGNGAVIAGAIDTDSSDGSTFGDDAGEPGDLRPTVRFVRSRVEKNGAAGIVALDDSVLELESTSVTENRKYGLDLRDCEARIDGGAVVQNKQGSVLVGRSSRVALGPEKQTNVQLRFAKD